MPRKFLISCLRDWIASSEPGRQLEDDASMVVLKVRDEVVYPPFKVCR